MLALFDIDGTLLLKATAEHRDAVHAAITRVYGVPIPAMAIEAAGRTDFSIARSILLAAGIADDEISRRFDDFRAVACEEFARRCPDDLSAFVAPGMAQALEQLHGRDGWRLALLTGNLEPIGRLKVARAGLGRFFERGQGAFGSDDEDRAALPAVARARAGARDRPYPRERTVVIGDTPRDIACARADGVRCVAITTGPFAAEALSGADVVVGHARSLVPALDALAA